MKKNINRDRQNITLFYENLYAHGLDCQIISDFFLASKVAAPMNILYLYLCLYFVLIRDFLHSVFLASWVAAAMNILTGLSFNAWWENRPCVFYDNLYIFFTKFQVNPFATPNWTRSLIFPQIQKNTVFTEEEI